MNVKIIGEHKQKKIFDTPDEFNTYYETHKTDIDSRTTNQLNRELSVTGYKIAKRNIQVVDGKRVGELYLVPIRDMVPLEVDNADRYIVPPGHEVADQSETYEVSPFWEIIKELASEVDRINTKMKSLETSLSKILTIINS